MRAAAGGAGIVLKQQAIQQAYIDKKRFAPGTKNQTKQLITATIAAKNRKTPYLQQQRGTVAGDESTRTQHQNIDAPCAVWLLSGTHSMEQSMVRKHWPSIKLKNMLQETEREKPAERVSMGCTSEGTSQPRGPAAGGGGGHKISS